MTDKAASVLGLPAAFYLSLTDSPDTPGKTEVMIRDCNEQIRCHAAACITIGVCYDEDGAFVRCIVRRGPGLRRSSRRSSTD